MVNKLLFYSVLNMVVNQVHINIHQSEPADHQ